MMKGAKAIPIPRKRKLWRVDFNVDQCKISLPFKSQHKADTAALALRDSLAVSFVAVYHGEKFKGGLDGANG